MMKLRNDKGLFTAEYSLIGENHVTKGIENQDQIKFGEFASSVRFLVVSDGVSSAAHALLGATAAVETVEKLAMDISSNKILMNDIKAIQSYLVKHWKENFVADWNQYAATLNFIIYYDHQLLLGQLGDGLIALTVDGETKVMKNYEEFYSSETPALGEVVLRKDLKVESCFVNNSFSGYIVTDGIGKEVNEDSYMPLERYLFELSMNPELFVKEIVPWIDGLGAKNGDDKTLGYIRMEDL